MTKIDTLIPVLLCLLILGGCDTFRNTFGLDHYSPNEWDTTPNGSLILPPDFKNRPKLPPPTPGTPNPHAIPESVKAQKTVLGDAHTGEAPVAPSRGERGIVEKASENQAVTPDIRKIVDEEAQADSTVSGKVISRIQSWKKEASKNLGLSNSSEESTESADIPNQQAEEQ